mgnify:CR=1 FL=1
MSTVKKISLEHANELIKLGVMTQQKLTELQAQGLIAGQREKESHRLKGVANKITVSFPSPTVTLPKGMSLKDLPISDATKVKEWKTILSNEIRPIFNGLRDQYTDKVMIKQ